MGRQINVGVDVWNCRPVSETEIIDIVTISAAVVGDSN